MAEAKSVLECCASFSLASRSCCPAWWCRSSSTTPPGPPSTPPGPASRGELLIAPRLEDRYPSYGVLASIEQVGRVAGGSGTAAVVRGERRAQIGAGVTGPGAALWVEVTEVDRARSRPTRPASWPPSTRSWWWRCLQRREAWQVIDSVNKLTDPSALADTAGYAPYLTARAEAAAAGDARRRRAAARADRLDPRAPRRGGGHRQDRRGRPRGHGEDAAGVPAAPAARRDPQGARRGRARRVRRLPRPRRGRRPAREGPRGRAARGRQAGALQRAEPRGRLDPHLAGHRARAAVERHAPRTRPT